MYDPRKLVLVIGSNVEIRRASSVFLRGVFVEIKSSSLSISELNDILRLNICSVDHNWQVWKLRKGDFIVNFPNETNWQNICIKAKLILV